MAKNGGYNSTGSTEIVGFICAGLMIYFAKLKRKSNISS